MDTKIVEGTFGPKQVTRDEFVRRWENSVVEVGHLCQTTEDYQTYEAIRSQVREMALRKWETI